MLKVGMVGLGRIGLLHMMNCLKIDDVKIVAVADPSKKALKKAKSAGVDMLYGDFHDLFNHSSNIDAVIISVPNFLHLENIRLALEADLDVFVEKPMATTVKECKEIVSLVEKSGRKLMVGHYFRFLSAIEKMKQKLNNGLIGNLEVATLEEVINGPFSHPRVPIPVSDWWFDQNKSGGGALLDIGYHMLDLFSFFAGDSKVIFSCIDHKFNISVEDGAIVVLQSLNRSTKGIVNVGWYQKTIFPKFDFRVILHGAAGYLSSDALGPKNLYFHAMKEGTKNLLKRVSGRKISPLSYTYYYEPYYKELVHFFNCVENDLESPVSASEAMKTVELVHDAYKMSQRDVDRM